jgi:hypothetical protein
MDLEAGRCACGARLVGEPILEPPAPRPVLGAAIGSALFAGLSVASLWVRPALALVPLALALGVRAIRAARRDPSRHGGVRTATAGVALASVVAVGVGGYLVARIPRALEARQESQLAATRAEMYRVSSLVHQYRATYGSYPNRMSDLARVAGTVPEARDAWAHRLVYASFTREIASASGGPTLDANFELRSPGPDGTPNTADDILMRDGQIVDARNASAPAKLPVTMPVTKSGR